MVNVRRVVGTKNLVYDVFLGCNFLPSLLTEKIVMMIFSVITISHIKMLLVVFGMEIFIHYVERNILLLEVWMSMVLVQSSVTRIIL